MSKAGYKKKRGKWLPDECVDLLGLNVIHLLHRTLDLLLVGADVDYENKGIVVLNFFHSRFRGQGILEYLVLIELVARGSADPGILWSSLLGQCLGSVESDLSTHLLDLLLEGTR